MAGSPKTTWCPGEMAQWLRRLVVLPEDLGLIPSTHVVAQNHLSSGPGDPAPSSVLQRQQVCS